MEKWKINCENSGIIKSYQTVSRKIENVCRKSIPCRCCHKEISVGNTYFEYLIRPKNENEIGHYLEPICVNCDGFLDAEDESDDTSHDDAIEYVADELNLIEIRDDNIELKAMMKFRGLKLIVHPRDRDPFPSIPHAHVYEKGWKVNLYTGKIHDTRTKKTIRIKIYERDLTNIVNYFKSKGIEFN